MVNFGSNIYDYACSDSVSDRDSLYTVTYSLLDYRRNEVSIMYLGNYLNHEKIYDRNRHHFYALSKFQ